MKQYIVFFTFLLILVGCANESVVILVPDDQGNVGEVVVTGANRSVRITEPWCSTRIDDSGKPGEVRPVSREKVKEVFGRALDAGPVAPLEFCLYFLSGQDSLLPESIAELPAIVEAVLARKNYEITIIGHTDRTGDDASNLRLSKKRTQTVQKLLVENGIPLEALKTIRHYGENVPLIPTADGVAEPKNRRVEIFVQ